MFYTWCIDQFAETNSIVMNGEGDWVNVSRVHANCKLQMKYSAKQKARSGELQLDPGLNKSQGVVAQPSA